MLLIFLNQLIFQVGISEREVILDTLAPATFKIEVDVRSLFLFLVEALGAVVALEPGRELLVEPVAVALQLLRGQVVLVRALLVVEDEEERIGLELLEQLRIREARGHFLRVVRRRCLRVGGDVGLQTFDIGSAGEIADRHVEHSHR